MVKLLGTVSTKGDRANWRHSRFIDFPIAPYFRNDVYQRINSCGALSTTGTKVQTPKNTVYASRSESDFALAVHYKRAGLGKEAALGSFAQNMRSAENDRVDDHKRIVEKVFDQGEDQLSKPSVSVPTTPILHTTGDKLDEHKERLLRRKDRANPEMSTGLTLIDRHTWGLRRGEIFTIAARPRNWKNFNCCINRCARVARESKRILYFTSEMSVDSTYDRLLQVLSELPGDKFTTGSFTPDDRIKLDAAYEELRGFGERLTICDACSPDINQVKPNSR